MNLKKDVLEAYLKAYGSSLSYKTDNVINVPVYQAGLLGEVCREGKLHISTKEEVLMALHENLEDRVSELKGELSDKPYGTIEWCEDLLDEIYDIVSEDNENILYVYTLVESDIDRIDVSKLLEAKAIWKGSGMCE